MLKIQLCISGRNYIWLDWLVNYIEDWFVTVRGGTFKLHLNLLQLCPPGRVTLRANAIQDNRTSGCTSLQTSIIAGLSFSPPSLVANYTSFNKADYRPWISLSAPERGTARGLHVLQRSPGAKKLHIDELYTRRPKKLCGPHHHAYSLNSVLKSSRQTLLYNQYNI